jgi:cytochrome oxidase Cu insertion factor (SCO1/SenC/PrrC family)
MRRVVLTATVCSILSVAALAQTPAPAPQAPELKVKAGDTAPAFDLPGTDGKQHKLSDYRGKTVVLAWFPKAGTQG